ncbi:hypothetical protein AB0A74_05290 [Saccharothrix sp. NPDC042600]|uniref:hypothetical protein n=1 Tax=Saccharothrix TaxID=2071 RepID=UPI0033D40A4D|nr:hypothetical protein GCM10017745_37140 [Saccharothrix mutabilis subsp. capreolus]
MSPPSAPLFTLTETIYDPATAPALRITVTNRGDRPFTCTKLVLSCPTTEIAAAPRTNGDSDGWTVTQDSGDTVALPGTDASTIPPGDRVSVVLGPLRGLGSDPVALGTLVEGTFDGDSDPTRSAATHRLQANKHIRNFRGSSSAVDYEEDVDLVWEGADSFPPKGYHLKINASDPVRLDEKAITKNGDAYRYRVPKLTANTVFQLTAADESGVALVMVHRGDVHAGTLTVRGTVSMVGRPAKIYNGAHPEWECTMPSDGFILATARAKAGGQATSMTTSVHPPHDDKSYSFSLNPGNGRVDNVLIPVQCGACVLFTIPTTDRQNTYEAVWFPLGYEVDAPECDVSGDSERES